VEAYVASGREEEDGCEGAFEPEYEAAEKVPTNHARALEAAAEIQEPLQSKKFSRAKSAAQSATKAISPMQQTGVGC
jgi:hypothetical protein